MTTLDSKPGFSDPKGFSAASILLETLPGDVLALDGIAVVQALPLPLTNGE